MIELLRSLEWSVYGACPSCRQVSSHAPDCRLDRAIRGLAEGSPGEPVCACTGPARDAHNKGCPVRKAHPRVDLGDVPVSEPTVDEMAADLGLTRGPGRWVSRSSGVVLLQEPTGWYRMGGRGVVYPSDEAAMRAVWEEQRPSMDEMAREMGLVLVSSDSDHWWEDVETGASRLTRRCIGAEWQYFEDWRRWPTDADAIRTLYREHKAKHADPPDEELERVLGRSVTKEEEPPTDPSALAAWLYARVVPGRTVAETFDEERGIGPGVRYKNLITGATFDLGGGLHFSTTTGGAIDARQVTRLLNPDGSTLWEAKC